MSEFSHALGADPTTGAIPQKTLDWLAENLPDSGTSGSGIEYVSGIVTPDPAVAVHEYFTTGAATIDGVEYAAEQAVVLFRIQGTWVHKVVDLPRPPTVMLLDAHVSNLTGGSGSTTFNFTGSGTVPEDGLRC